MTTLIGGSGEGHPKVHADRQEPARLKEGRARNPVTTSYVAIEDMMQLLGASAHTVYK
jgi:hypothetical protein